MKNECDADPLWLLNEVTDFTDVASGQINNPLVIEGLDNDSFGTKEDLAANDTKLWRAA